MSEFVDIPGQVSRSRTLVPNQSIDIAVVPRVGQLRITVLSLQANPKTSGKPRSDPEDPFETPLTTKGLPVRIRIHRPNGTASTFNVHEPLVDLDDILPSVEVEVPEGQHKRRWRVTITNKSNESARVQTTVFFVAKRHLLRTTRVPISLLNGAARELVKGLGLRIHVDSSGSFIDFSEDLKRHSGGSLARREFDVPVLSDINLRTINARVVTERENGRERVFFEVFARFEEQGKEIDFGPLEGEIRNMAVRTRFAISYHRNRLVYVPTVELGLLVDSNIFLKTAAALLDVLTDFSSAIGLSGDLDIDEISELVESEFERILRTVHDHVSEFLTDGIMHLAEQGHVLSGFDTDGRHLLVTHFDRSREEEGRRFSRPKDRGGLGPVLTGAAGAGVLPGEHSPRGPLFKPSEADIEGAALLQNHIDHIVVLMMENRSFDHLFGHISLPLGNRGGLGQSEYNGLTGGESNLASSTGPVIDSVRIEDERTRFGFSPGHSFESVASQINDGKMDGFVKDFVARFGGEEISQVNPMGYYGAGALPAYDFMIKHFAVCTSWFCSHPGPTWPNRFCTLAGSTPEVNNLSISDPRVGYLGMSTVFDKLSRDEWVNYESDVSFLRMFDRYRLDDQNIRPVGEFFDRAGAGQLPLFTFIDPDYTDIIPIDRAANDDHPPADMRNGQLLVERIYNALRSSPKWDRTMFVLTYDEHGGFFDHQAPPGTAENPDSTIALVHPDGQPFLGPRVPSIAISPWTLAGPSQIRLEHTSIIKTVLLRKFGPVHPFMGQRVQRSNNLGLLLTSPVLRNVPPMPELSPPPKGGSPARPDPGPRPRGDDYHEAVRRFSIPA